MSDAQYLERIADALERISYACYDENGEAPLQRIARALDDGDDERTSSIRRIADALTCSDGSDVHTVLCRICEDVDRLGDKLGGIRVVLEAFDRSTGEKIAR